VNQRGTRARDIWIEKMCATSCHNMRPQLKRPPAGDMPVTTLPKVTPSASSPGSPTVRTA